MKIRSFYSDQFEQTNGTMKLIIESAQICADVAIERGAWNMEYGSRKYAGRYLTQWKMINGSWLTQLDVSLLDE